MKAVRPRCLKVIGALAVVGGAAVMIYYVFVLMLSGLLQYQMSVACFTVSLIAGAWSGLCSIVAGCNGVSCMASHHRLVRCTSWSIMGILMYCCAGIFTAMACPLLASKLSAVLFGVELTILLLIFSASAIYRRAEGSYSSYNGQHRTPTIG